MTIQPIAHFGGYLRVLRRKARLTQAELGIATGYSDAQISRLESGRRPPDLSTLVALFLPALDLQPHSHEAQQLLDLAMRSRDDDLSSTPATPQKTTNVVPAMPLFGREHDSELVFQQLQTAHLVTIMGVAGVGKTQLARYIVEHEAERYPDGSVFVDVTSAQDTAQLLAILAQTLGLGDEASANVHDLAALLGDQKLLIALDNCEQVRGMASLMQQLLKAAPNVRWVLTSRLALRIGAEHLIPLAPLAVPNLVKLPPLDQLAHIPAMALLLDRLRLHTPNLHLTNENALALAAICVKVDGLPLAIELVAAHGRLFSPQELLTEVVQHFSSIRRRQIDGMQRHHSLTDALAWSYQQLDPAAQRLFAQLSVFNTWTLEAIAAICRPNNASRSDVLSALHHLLDHSLVQRHEAYEQTRLTMLAMVRSFASDQHDRHETNALFHAALSYFIDHVAGVVRHLQVGQGDQAQWLAWLDADHETLRTLLHWAKTHDPERGLKLAGLLWRFWYLRGYLREGRQWLNEFLAMPNDTITDRAFALDGLGILAWRQSDPEPAHRSYHEALALFQDSGDREGEAKVLSHWGLLHNDFGTTEDTIRCYEQSLAISRSLNDEIAAVSVLHNLGNLYCQLNENEKAAVLYAECELIYRKTGDVGSIALIKLGLGNIARDQGDGHQAHALFIESMKLARLAGDDWCVATAQTNLCVINIDLGDLPTARSYAHEALAYFDKIGDQASVAVTHLYLAAAEMTVPDFATAVNEFRQCLIIAHAIDFNDGIASALEGMATCRAHMHPHQATRLISYATMLREQSGSERAITAQPEYDQTIQTLKNALDSKLWQKAWNEGQALTNEQILAEALKI